MVKVDDLLPVDTDGVLLLPVSSLRQELWPLIVTKAVCKLLYSVWESRSEAKFGEQALVSMFTGWAPETLPLCAATKAQSAQLLRDLCNLPLHHDQLEPATATMNSTFSETNGASDLSSTATVSDGAGGSTFDKKSPKKAGGFSRATSVLSASSAVPPPAVEVVTPENEAPSNAILVQAHCTTASLQAFFNGTPQAEHSSGTAALGLRPELSHTMRILTFTDMPSLRARGNADSDLDDAVVELESPLSLFTGRLGFQDTSQSWRMSHSLALQTSKEVTDHIQNENLQMHAEGRGHPAFRFHMFFSDFCRLFTSMSVFHRLDVYPYAFTLATTVCM